MGTLALAIPAPLDPFDRLFALELYGPSEVRRWLRSSLPRHVYEVWGDRRDSNPLPPGSQPGTSTTSVSATLIFYHGLQSVVKLVAVKKVVEPERVER